MDFNFNWFVKLVICCFVNLVMVTKLIINSKLQFQMDNGSCFQISWLCLAEYSTTYQSDLICSIRIMSGKVAKVMVQPINLLFRYLQNKSRIQVWVYEQVNLRLEGQIIGFDEYMNLVLDDAEEVNFGYFFLTNGSC